MTETTEALDEKRIRDTDDNAVWTVIGLKDCTWTKKALRLLEAHKEPHKHIIINTEWQRRLVVEFNCRRSPAIFKGARYFGSADVLENYYKCTFFSSNENL
jgi:glutaredoxin